jgi:hypothetical protein
MPKILDECKIVRYRQPPVLLPLSLRRFYRHRIVPAVTASTCQNYILFRSIDVVPSLIDPNLFPCICSLVPNISVTDDWKLFINIIDFQMDQIRFLLNQHWLIFQIDVTVWIIFRYSSTTVSTNNKEKERKKRVDIQFPFHIINATHISIISC